MIDALSPLNALTDLALRMETVVAEVENASVMALRTNTSLLPDPKRLNIIPMPRIPEEGTDGLSDVDGERDGNMGGGLASGNRTRFMRICMPRVILRSPPGYRREKPPILRLRARHTCGDPDGLVPVRLGTLDRECDGL